MSEQFSRYTLIEKVSSGGMGEVYKAWFETIEGFRKIVALKRILPGISSERNFQKMFIKEAKISAMLNHSNVVQTYDFGRVGENYFIAMEYIVGWSLRELFDQCEETGVTIPFSLALEIVRQICAGLRYAHDFLDTDGNPLSIVHRDLGPTNILIGVDGQIKIIDFGVARLVDATTETTNVNVFKGKFAYTAPEMISGIRADQRADIFSAGILLYELTTGKHPFMGETIAATLERIRTAEYVPPREIKSALPVELDKVLGKMLVQDREKRYSGVSELIRDLEEIPTDRDDPPPTDLAHFIRKFFKGTEKERKLSAEESDWSYAQLLKAPGPSVVTEIRGRRYKQMILVVLVGILTVLAFVRVFQQRERSFAETFLVTNAIEQPLTAERPNMPVPKEQQPASVNGKSPPVVHKDSASTASATGVQERPESANLPAFPKGFLERKARLRLYVEPKDAVLFLNGKNLGRFDNIERFSELPIGREHVLRAEKDGYEAQEVHFVLSAGDVKSLELKLFKKYGVVKVSPNVPCEIYRDAVYQGISPRDEVVDEGEYVIRLRNQELGIEEEIPVSVLRGQTVEVLPVFQGSLVCSEGNPEVFIVVDGVRSGTCDRAVVLPVGRHKISLESEGLPLVSRELLIRNEETTVVEIPPPLEGIEDDRA